MKPRLAIHFSGHLRTFEQTYKSFKKYILEPNQIDGWEIDIFIHTWNEIELSKSVHYQNDPQAISGQVLSDREKNLVKKIYAPVSFEISEQLLVDDNFTITQLTGDTVEFKNILNAFYTKYQVNKLRIEYEKKNNIKYDLVLHTRGDILYENEFKVSEILDIYEFGLLKKYQTIENKLFYTGSYRDPRVKEDLMLMQSDILYFATPKVMNKIADIFLHIEKINLKKEFIVWEYFFASQVQQLGIKTVQLLYAPFTDWRILRFNENTVESKGDKLKRYVKYLIPPIAIKLYSFMSYKIYVYSRKKKRKEIDKKNTKYCKSSHNMVAEYIHKKYFNKKLKIFSLKAKKDLGTDKIIWQFWGSDSKTPIPEIVEVCMKSVNRHKGDYMHIVLTNENIHEYIDLPEFVYDKLKNNKEFTYTFFSDLLRASLLSVYGGVWCDAVVYLSGKIPQHILKQNFFLFQRGPKPLNYKEWEQFSPYYFSWDDNFKVRSLSSFIVAKKNNPIIQELLSHLLHYWYTEKTLRHYFFMQILFNEIIKNYNNCMMIIDDTYPHVLAKNIYEPYTKELWDELTKNNSIHKLSYYQQKNSNSILDFIIELDSQDTTKFFSQ